MDIWRIGVIFYSQFYSLFYSLLMMTINDDWWQLMTIDDNWFLILINQWLSLSIIFCLFSLKTWIKLPRKIKLWVWESIKLLYSPKLITRASLSGLQVVMYPRQRDSLINRGNEIFFWTNCLWFVNHRWCSYALR